MDYLNGKTISHIDRSTHDEFVLIHFTDGSMWLLLAVLWNCAGARLEHSLSFGHHKPDLIPTVKREGTTTYLEHRLEAVREELRLLEEAKRVSQETMQREVTV